jgi:hypothetical protein
MDEAERGKIRAEFGRVTNMSPAELERWLQTEESQGVGWTHEGEKESVGHQEGRRIAEIKRKKPAELGDDNLAQRPGGDVTGTRWRHSLMNWGHDPLNG